jgi:hypothetical protein
VSSFQRIDVWHGVSKRVEDGHRLPALRTGHPWGNQLAGCRWVGHNGLGLNFRQSMGWPQILATSLFIWYVIYGLRFVATPCHTPMFRRLEKLSGGRWGGADLESVILRGWLGHEMVPLYIYVNGWHGRMATGGHGLLKVLPGPAMPHLSTLCGWDTSEMGLRPFQGWPDHRAGGLRLSSIPLDTPCHTSKMAGVWNVLMQSRSVIKKMVLIKYCIQRKNFPSPLIKETWHKKNPFNKISSNENIFW